jgi:hypothetical protein
MTVAEAKRLIAKSRKDRRRPSNVNPGMTHQQALDVLERAIVEMPDETDLEAMRGGLMARNIRRECVAF